MPIPKLIHQTFFKKTGLHPRIEENMASLVANNPGWSYNFYTDDDCVDFIKQHYGQEMLDAYFKINPSYGAARSDFFRYLLIYAVGGVYLDIKSSVSVSLDRLTSNSEYILSHWPSAPKGMFEDWYQSSVARLSSEPPNGEFQQWHIIAAPKHPFLEAVIDRVVKNIHDPAKASFCGGIGVIRMTGPVPYTLAILPVLKNHPHTLYRSHPSAGLVYSVMQDMRDHYFLYGNKGNRHYSRFKHPVIGDAKPEYSTNVWLDTAYTLYERAIARKQTQTQGQVA